MSTQARIPKRVGSYVPREYIGSGAWKIAFRATSNNLSDVALLMLKDKKNASQMAADAYYAIKLCNNHEYFSYLAEFIGIQKNEDGDFFIIEELLVRSLNFEAPLRNVAKWVGYARDLSRGLTCIHENQNKPLVHRDLKLDNCGVSQNGIAKIFDLGSLTTEGGNVECTIFTRAPELFHKDEKFTTSADVWALGATLFALRTGEYPFVISQEISRRREIHDDLFLGQISEEEAAKVKSEIDGSIRQRALRKDAESSLFSEIDSRFNPSASSILKEMLSFDPSRRNKIRSYAARWSELADSLSDPISPTSTPHSVPQKWAILSKMLMSVLHGELAITVDQIKRQSTQWDKDKRELLKAPDVDKSKIDEIEELMIRVKAYVEDKKSARTRADH